MLNNHINSSDLPYRARVDANDAFSQGDPVPQTVEGERVASIAERLRTCSAVETTDIELISLAAAAHPDVLNGQILLWVDNQGEALTAFDPDSPLLWHEGPQQLSNSGRHVLVVRCDDGRFSARVDGKFIAIDGDETLYKALLTVVQQYGADVVSDEQGKELRLMLAMLMYSQADTLGWLWQNKTQALLTWESQEWPGTDDNHSLCALAERHHTALANRGNFTFVPTPSDKGKVLASIAGLINFSPLPMGNQMTSGSPATMRGKVAPNDIVIPLIAATTAAAVVNRPFESKTVRTALGTLSLAGLVFAGKQLMSWYTSRNEQDLYAPQQHYDAMIAPTVATTVQPEPDDVRVERIDLSCVEERQQLSFANVLRKIGKTLCYPITELAKETQVIIFYEKFNRCPSDKDVENLAFITMGIDSFISSFMSLLPQGNTLNLVQSIGGPLFQLLADAIENKELDMDNVNAVNDQILFLARTTWHFSPKERNGELNMEKIKIPENTFFKKNVLSTIINNDFFNLHCEGNQYVGKSSHSNRPVTYSHSEGEWVFLEDEAYLYEVKYHEDMVDDYKVTNSYIREIKKYKESHKGISMDKKNNILYVLKKDNGFSKFIFMPKGNNKFNVESDFYEIKKINYSYAKKENHENKIVRLNRNTFFFETRSARINEKLSVFFDKSTSRQTISEVFHVSSIMDDGFSYDDKNQKYLKYNNGYYKVESDAFNCEYILYIEEGKQQKCYIKKNKLGFIDVDNGFSHRGTEHLIIKTDEEFFIENKTAHEIIKNCEPHGEHVKNKIEQGVVKNENGQLFFSLNGKLYKVVEYKDNVVTIKSKYSNVNDILIYMVNDYFFEIKNNESQEKNNFIDLSPALCKVKRSPTVGSCHTISISQIADKILRAKTEKGAVDLGNTEGDLRISKFFPGVFLNTQNNKLYFKYEGSFFRASFDRDMGNNLLRQRTLHIYYKGLLGGRKNIASLIFDVINGKTYVQTQEEKLQWSTGMTSRESVDFALNHDYLKMTDFAKLEDVVAEVNKKKSLRFITTTSEFAQVDIREVAKTNFLYDNDDFRIVSLDDINDEEPFYVRGGGLMMRNAIKYATEQLDVAIRELKAFTPNAQKYIGYVLDVDNHDVMRDFAKQLSHKLKEIKIKLQSDNIKVVTKNRQAIEGHFAERDTVRDSDMLLNSPKHEGYFHKPALTEAQRKDGAFAFVPLDSVANIYVCLDRLHLIDPIHPDKTLRNNHLLDVPETLIHEAAHSTGVNQDIIYISTDDGKLAPILDAIDEFKQTIINNSAEDKDALEMIQQEYMKLHPEYFRFREQPQGESSMTSYLFSHDPGFKANLLLATPDFFAIFARDLYLNSAVVLRKR